MFEYWFKTESSGHEGTTSDFLEVMCQIAIHLSVVIAGDFLTAFLTEKHEDLDFLRVDKWDFEFHVDGESVIKLRKYF